MIKIKIVLLMTIFLFLVRISSNGQSQNYATPRAISINDVEFEVKGNVLGVFYNSPVVDFFQIEGDSIRIKGVVYHQHTPREGVHFYTCRRKRPTLRQHIGRQQMYVLNRYLMTTSDNGQFVVVIHKKYERLLYRDFNLNQDGFLLFD